MICSTANAQWIEENSGVTSALYQVVFPSSNIGYIDMSSNQLLKTTDAGANWDTTLTINIDSNPFIGYSMVAFPTVDTGFVVREFLFWPPGMLVLKTTDGANTWDTLIYTNTSGAYYPYFLDAWTGFFIKNNPNGIDTILKTTNGGVSFDTMAVQIPINSLYSVYFLNADTGFVLSDSGLLGRTYDGGLTWDTVNTGSSSYLLDMFFPTSQTGYMMTGNWLIKTTDGGNTWFQLPIVASGSFPMYFVSAGTGYVVMGNEIRKTTDGGFTWSIQMSGTSVNLNDIYFVNDNVGYAVGDSGTIYRTTNGGEVGITEKKREREIKVYPNPANENIRIEATVEVTVKNLKLFDLNGKLVREFNATDMVLGISGLAKGEYLLLIETDKAIFREKIILQ
jgi:photosystem II stability/assembly factor-like uncharacterized protein